MWEYRALLAGAFLVAVGFAIFRFAINREMRKYSAIDKGEKLLEYKYRKLDVMPKKLKYAVLIFHILLLFAIFVKFLYGDFFVASVFILMLIVNFELYFSQIKFEIYQKGIGYGSAFVKWEDITGVKLRDRTLEIKAWSFPVIMKVPSRDGRVYEIIAQKASRPV